MVDYSHSVRNTTINRIPVEVCSITQDPGYDQELAAMLTQLSGQQVLPTHLGEEDISKYAILQGILGQAIWEVEGGDDLDTTNEIRYNLQRAVKTAKTNLNLFLKKLIAEKMRNQ